MGYKPLRGSMKPTVRLILVEHVIPEEAAFGFGKLTDLQAQFGSIRTSPRISMDLAKMLVHRRALRQGVDAALLGGAEYRALEHRKTLLVVDTASGYAERLYARQGWQRCGEIPNYALMPDGMPRATTMFFTFLGK
jgi:GNAT superfamily N-acetyltransferase